METSSRSCSMVATVCVSVVILQTRALARYPEGADVAMGARVFARRGVAGLHGAIEPRGLAGLAAGRRAQHQIQNDGDHSLRLSSILRAHSGHLARLGM